MRVGFVGLGNMGHFMAANLQTAGHALRVKSPFDLARLASPCVLGPLMSRIKTVSREVEVLGR